MINYIYSLENETNSDVFYIGKTIWPYDRFLSHKYSCNTNDAPVYSFIKRNNIRFKMDIIEEINTSNIEDVYAAENYWIDQFRQWGFNLLNYQNYISRERKSYPEKYLKSRIYKLSKLYAILDTEAKELGRSRNWLLCKILTNYIESEERIKNPE